MKIDQFISGVVVDNLVDSIVLVAPDGTLLDANAAALAYYGYTRAEMLALNVRDIRAPRDQGLADAQYREATEHPTTFEVLAQRSDGTRFPVECRALRVEGDNEFAILSTVRDISERKQRENALSQSETDLLEAQRLARVGSWVFDPTTGALEWSDEMFRIWGLDPKLGAPSLADHGRLTHPDDHEQFEAFSEALTHGTPFSGELRILHPDGSVRTVIASCEAQLDADGSVIGLRGTNQDITERKRAENAILTLNAELDERVQERTRALTAANEHLAEANRVKSDFLAAMSHELRTPLNSIIGFSDLLGRGMVGELEPEQDKQIRIINASGRQLLSLVEGILDLSKIEAGQIRPTFTEFEVAPLVSGVAEMLRPAADSKGLRLAVSCEPGADRLTSDSGLVSQIVTNLLGNAIKFTDIGSVSLTVTREDGHIAFDVTDTGRGISAGDLPHIMERFYQGKATEEAKNQGAGLGLSISASLAEMIGATLETSSEDGAGSTFTLRVPVRASAASPVFDV